MNKLINAFLVTVFITNSASAQMLHPVVIESFMDTSARPAASPAGRSAQFGTGKRDRLRSFTGVPGEKYGKDGPCGYHNKYDRAICPWMMFHPAWRHPLITALFIASCLFVWLTVNILFTVLVWRDMMRRGQFNGLWIPVLLLVGIPGTALYALFRIGDAVEVRE